MANNLRHYRVAQKEVLEEPKMKDGFFVSKKETKKFMIFLGIFSVLVFLKGIIIGHTLGRD